MRFVFTLAAACLVTLSVEAFQPIPKESAKALGVTRGKPFSSGVVFINGKYIEPPYTVERWGTGIRINSIPVTGQVISWEAFLKTQPDVKVEKKEPVVEPPPPEQVEKKEEISVSEAKSSLDELFGDDPKPEKETSAPADPVPAPVASAAPAAPKPAKPSVTYMLSGKFKPNDESKVLLARINTSRTEIDRMLRSGGFICCGNSYSMVQGDKRTLMELLEKLPELQQHSPDVQSFCLGLRNANLVYLNEVLRWDLYRNRLDYRKLKERREKLKADAKWDHVLDDVSGPIL